MRTYFRFFQRHLLSLLTLICVIPQAMAGGPEYAPVRNSGFYITGSAGGASFQNDRFQASTLTAATGQTGTATNVISANDAWNFIWAAGLGWQFNDIFRIDALFMDTKAPWTSNSVSTQSSVGIFGLFTQSTQLTTQSDLYFLNGYVDLMSLFSRNRLLFRPYVGGGVGFAENRTYNTTTYTNTLPSFIVQFQSGKRTNFAYRVILGANFMLTRHFRAFTEYNYIGGGQYVFGAATVNNQTVFTALPKFNFCANVFSAGLAYTF